MESATRVAAEAGGDSEAAKKRCGGSDTAASEAFRMPVHYPRYTRGDYERMPEWKLNVLLADYGLPFAGSLDHKRDFAIGAFLWPPTSR